jgi:hypothetical protein
MRLAEAMTACRPLAAVFLASLLVLAACGNRPAAGVQGSASVPPTPGASSVASPAEPTAHGPAASSATAAADGPPMAGLAAEGGDPVTGQLGSYTWHDAGSDAPWLPGTPLTVGAGEPLTVRFDPPTAISSWRARVVPATNTDAAGARSLGEGSATPPMFDAPDVGRWTVELQVLFAADAGDAVWFWSLTVP